jgi:hypothetical protein
MGRTIRKWNRPLQWFLLLISVAFLVNSFLVFVTIHGQQEHVEGSFHGLLRVGGSKNSDNLWWIFHQGSPVTSSRLTEREYWHRMLQQDGLNASDCNRNRTISYLKEVNNKNSNYSTTISNSFRDDIRIHVQQHPNAPACVPPPTEPQCHEASYSVLLYYYCSHNEYIPDEVDDRSLLRPLVTRIMALLAYPSVHDIHLVVSNHVAARWEGSDKNQPKIGKYGQRIRQWEDQGKIHIYVTTATKTLWDVVAKVANSIQTQSVLWIDAAPRKDWNGTMLKSQLHFWRRHPDVITVQRSEVMDGRQLQQQHRLDCHVPSLHGMMIHHHYLCLLSHPVVKMFVQKHSALWLEDRMDATTVAISLVLLHASPWADAWYTMTQTTNNDYSSRDEHKVTSRSPSTIPLLLEYFGCPCIPDIITNANDDALLVNNGPCPDQKSVEVVNRVIPKQPINNISE